MNRAVWIGVVVTMSACLPIIVGCGSSAKGKGKEPDLEWLIANRELAKAEELCRKNVQSATDVADAHGALARVLCLRGNAELRKAGFFDKKDVHESADNPKYAKAVEFFKQAAIEAEAALAKKPKFSSVRGTLGLALYRTGETGRAVQELSRARQDLELARQELNKQKRDFQADWARNVSDSAQLLNTLGLISYETGKKNDALAYYQAALALDDGQPEATYNVALLYQEEHEATGSDAARQAAVQYYGLYLKRSGGEFDAQARAALERLSGGKPEGKKL